MSYQIVYHGNNAVASFVQTFLKDAGIDSIIGSTGKFLGWSLFKADYGIGFWSVLVPENDYLQAKGIIDKNMHI